MCFDSVHKNGRTQTANDYNWLATRWFTARQSSQILTLIGCAVYRSLRRNLSLQANETSGN